MSPNELEQLASQLNPMHAVRQVEDINHAKALLLHYYTQLKPVKANCQNISKTHGLYLSLMGHLYKQTIAKQTGRQPYIRLSGCGLPDALRKVENYLVGVGLMA